MYCKRCEGEPSHLIYYSSNLTSKPSPFNSCINTLNDSGNPGSGIGSPFTIDS
jgi:hypothetical protein